MLIERTEHFRAFSCLLCYDLAMDTTTQQSVIMNQMLEPLTKDFGPETAKLFANIQATPEMVARLEVLAEKSNEGELSEAERSEYETYVRVGNLFAVLKAKGKKALSPNS